MSSRQELWKELERRITSLIDALAPWLKEDDLVLLRDFVENREYGVALEWLASIVSDRGIALGADQAREVEALAEEMKLDLAASRRSPSSPGPA
jgi:hypothetical protein